MLMLRWLFALFEFVLRSIPRHSPIGAPPASVAFQHCHLVVFMPHLRGGVAGQIMKRTCWYTHKDSHPCHHEAECHKESNPWEACPLCERSKQQRAEEASNLASEGGKTIHLMEETGLRGAGWATGGASESFSGGVMVERMERFTLKPPVPAHESRTARIQYCQASWSAAHKPMATSMRAAIT
jgi:hypothetical protein